MLDIKHDPTADLLSPADPHNARMLRIEDTLRTIRGLCSMPDVTTRVIQRLADDALQDLLADPWMRNFAPVSKVDLLDYQRLVNVDDCLHLIGHVLRKGYDLKHAQNYVESALDSLYTLGRT